MAKTKRAEAKRNVVGARVKMARHQFSPPLTQDQLAGKLAKISVQLDRVAIAKIESGLRCVFDFELRAFAKVLRVDVRWLLDIDSASPGASESASNGGSLR
jgi:hypothetical protein